MQGFGKSSFILACGVVFTSLVHATSISGVGYAQDREASKKEALSDLAGNIKSDVRSHFESVASEKGSSATSNIKVSSNLPILGADFEHYERPLEVETTATLHAKNVKKLYINKLKNIRDDIASLLIDIKKSKSSSEKLKLYEAIYALLSEYDRYESVAVVLGVKQQSRPTISKAQVSIELDKLSSNIDSIDLACTMLAKEFGDTNIYVYPPLLENTTTASEFSSIFQKQLKAKLKTSNMPKAAAYILMGEYTLSKDAMILNYELLSTESNSVKKSKTIKISQKAYASYKTKPANINFDQLLNSGVVSSSALKVQLNSNRGSEGLLFRSGEEIELFVKLNKMGYFYIVGYTQTNEGKMSYLLELGEGHGASKFVKFVNADDANRWMSLGAFEVSEPYGVESLQIIASNKKITELPNYNYDPDTEYYVISNDIKKALAATRGIKKKKSKKKEMSEDVMSFTTMK